MKINNGQDNYDILFANKIEEIKRELKAWFKMRPACKKVLMVVDGNLPEIQKDEINCLLDVLSSFELEVSIKLIEPGELSKSINKAELIWSDLAERQFTRKDVLIGLGGGVIGDLTGFCASAYMRGIEFIQIPTTLLAQIDSSIGGKVAVNLPQGKNLVGAFYNPALVIMNSQFLKTVTEDVLSDGVGELIKYAYLGHMEIMASLDYFGNLDGFRKAVNDNSQVLTEMMILSLRIKKVLVENDFKETGIRRYLNFGHTIGHAIEIGENYRYSHGHCVANGCLWALRLSGDPLACKQLESIMTAYQIPIFEDLKIIDLMGYLRRDKKSENEGVNFVLPNRVESFNIGGDKGDFKAMDRQAVILKGYERAKPLSDELFLIGIQKYVKIQWIAFDELEERLKRLGYK